MSLLSGKVFEAINKGSVSLTHLADDVLNSITSKLPLSGGTLTGPLSLNGNGTNPLHAVTKQQLDGVAAQSTWELIDSRDAISGTSDQEFLGLGDYTEIMVAVHRTTRSVAANVVVQLSSDNGLTWLTSGYYRSGDAASADHIQITASVSGNSERSGNVSISRFNTADDFKPCVVSPLYVSTGTVATIEHVSPFNAVRVMSSSGEFTGGKVKIYGKK